jgi:uncharacterized protein (DUF362 family)
MTSASRIAYTPGLFPSGTAAVDLLERLGVAARLRTARRAFVKLNLCAGQRCDSRSGVCVGVGAVVALVEGLRAVAPHLQIDVGDSDSVGYGFAHEKFERQGLPRAAIEHSFRLVDLTRDRWSVREVAGAHFTRVPLPQTLLAADVFVSLSKIKTHNLTRVTGALKNDFGLLPLTEKHRLHPWLDDVLADLYLVCPPHLVVLDGCPAMEGNGPIHGDPVDLGVSLVGDDALATDAEMARLMGIAPERVGHLRRLARRLGLPGVPQADDVGSLPRPAVRPFRELGTGQKALIATGLRVQAAGANLEELGHLAHFARSLTDVRKVKRFGQRLLRRGRLT